MSTLPVLDELKANDAAVEAKDPTAASSSSSCSLSSPKSPTSPKSMAAKRWTLLRLVVRTGNIMRRSLRKEEKQLLDCLDNKDRNNDNDEQGILNEEHHCENRKSLLEYLKQNESNLPESEKRYFHQLVASPNVPSATVAKVRQTLLATTQTTAMVAAIRQEEKLSTHRSTLSREEENIHRNHDLTFRKQVWTSFQSLMESKHDEFHQKQQSLREEKKKEEEEEKQKRNMIGSAMFGFLFGSFQKQKQQEQQQQQHGYNSDDFYGFRLEDADEPLLYSVLGTSPDDNDCAPHVLTPPIMEHLRPHLPMAVQNDHFWLKYSLQRDGSNMRALCHEMRNSSRSIVAVETTQGDVFGCFCSSPWVPHGKKYFGSGESFVWRLVQSRYTPTASIEEQIELESTIEIFKWSGQNRNVQRLENQLDAPMVLGGGGPDDDMVPATHEKTMDYGSALVIMPTLEHGFSSPCLTFQSPALPPSSKDESFEIVNLEVWTLTPVDTLDQAEKVELGRRFIFDNSNFIEA